jgi:hypothetical protein
MFLLINSTLSGVGACYVIYDPYWNGIYLIGDNGSSWTGGTLGFAGILENTQCKVDTTRSSATHTTSGWTLNVYIELKTPFASSQKNVWVGAIDRANISSGWYQFGTWSPGPPAAWKGVNYSPRGHSYWRMYHEWDSANLGPVVEADMQTLSDNGFNMIHLYVWDRAFLQSVTTEAAGFIGPEGEPSLSPNKQWQHLDDLVGAAERHNIYVVINFVSDWPARSYGSYDNPSQLDQYIVSSYLNWFVMLFVNLFWYAV